MSDGRRERPFPVDPEAYPFRDHWLERGGVALHYVDEGDGRPVLMLHGNPTWSYLYREVIRELRAGCRCVAPDYPGFGMSDHPPGYGYTPEEHGDWIAALVERLDLRGMVLVVQDWGGPIGMAVATRRPDRVAGLVVCGTWCWPPGPWLRLFSLAMGGPVGRYLHRRHNLFARAMVPLGIARPERKPPAVRAAYTAPFPTPASREGTAVFPRAIRGSADWLRSIEARMGTLRDRPAELVWPMRDPAFGWERMIGRWQALLPESSVDRVEGASHYIQEDAPERVVAGVRRLLARLGPPGTD